MKDAKIFSIVAKKLIREEIKIQVTKRLREMYNGAMVREDESLYKKFMEAVLKAFADQNGLGNITSPQELPPEIKKKFYTYVDDEWKDYKARNGEGEQPGDQPEMSPEAPKGSHEIPTLTPAQQAPTPTKIEE